MREGDKNFKSVLSDDSALYQKKDTRTNSEKFKELSFKGKLQFFKDYYLSTLLILIGVAAVVIGIVVSALKPQPETVLHAVVVDNPFPDVVVNEIKSDITSLLITNEDDEAIIFDTDFRLSVDEMNVRMKLMAQIANNEIDIMILPAYELESNINSDLAVDLSTILDTETVEMLGNNLLNVSPFYSDDNTGSGTYGQPAPYAADITDYISERTGYIPRSHYMIIVPVNSRHTDAAAEFIRYIAEKMMH